jgi:cysteinyl-tRNA synthetase
MLNGKKIAKSDGNFFTLEQLEERGYDPMYLRYLFLQTNYRMQQNFTWEALDSAKTAYTKLVNIYTRNSSQTNQKGEVIASAKEKFTAAIEDDFNFPQAVAVLWDLAKSDAKAYDINSTIDDFDNVLGLKIKDHAKIIASAPKQLSDKISELVKEREQARINKDWAKADEIRQLLKTQYDYDVQDKSTK